jgi:nucleotidyltransferase substrate binding protein (TIGR01987 family)
MKEIFDSYCRSVERLSEVLKKDKTVEMRDSAIKRFELTVEMSWKLIQKFLRSEGVSCISPKDCLRGAFAIGLIKDDSLWVSMIEDRNQSVHTYDEAFADEVYERLYGYLVLFEDLRDSLRDRSSATETQ